MRLAHLRCRTLIVALLMPLLPVLLSRPAWGGAAPASFTEEAIARGVQYTTPQRSGLESFGYGVAFADLDSDDDADLVACGSDTGVIGLWENDGSGHYVSRIAGSGIPLLTKTSAVIAFDYDADGDLDVYFTRIEVANLLFRNDGEFQFTNVTATAGVGDTGPGMGPAAGDYDGDGYLDLYVPNYDGIDRVYRNLGNGTFAEVGGALGLADPWRGLQAVFFDFDRDGDADLYVSNDKKTASETTMHNRLYQNVGGTFVDISAASGTDVNMYSMGVAVGDFNGDGLPDLYCTNLAIEPNVLLLNMGGGQFLESQTIADVESLRFGWGALFFDYDHDRHTDLYVCSTFMPPGVPAPNRLYVHDGGWPCVDIAAAVNVDTSSLSYSIASADVDVDGDLDFVVQNNAGRLELFINHEGNSRPWTKVRVIGQAPNHFAVGATVAIRAGGVWDYREVMIGGNGYKGCNDLVTHFGLDNAPALEELVVTWPGGATRSMTGLPTNRTWHVYPPNRLGDCNGDEAINLADFSDFSNCLADTVLGPTECNCFDYNGDGVTNLPDLAAFQVAFGQ